jgi:hypothetical protein
MRILFKAIFASVLLMGISIGMAQVGTPIFVSDFENGSDGWTTYNDATNFTHDYVESGGTICAEDLSQGIDWYFQAPASWSGDWSRYYGAQIVYMLTTTGLDFYAAPDVVIETSNGTLAYVNATAVANVITTYEVPPRLWQMLSSTI